MLHQVYKSVRNLGRPLFHHYRYTLCDFVPTTITEMGHTQPSWQIDSSADITGNKVKAVDTGISGRFYLSFS